jgi:hypothetical protein
MPGQNQAKVTAGASPERVKAGGYDQVWELSEIIALLDPQDAKTAL